MNELRIIEQRNVLGKDFKMYGDFENPLFLATDVAKWIDCEGRTWQVLNAVDSGEKLTHTIYVSGQNRGMWFLTEDGLYEVLMQSPNPIAKEFKKEVKAILKSIRKNNIYDTDITIDRIIADPDFAIQLLTNLKEEKQRRIQAEQQAEVLAIQLDESKQCYTIKRVAHLNGIDWKSLDRKQLKEKSREMGFKVDKIFDANFGAVDSYHEDVWKTVYPNLVY